MSFPHDSLWSIRVEHFFAVLERNPPLFPPPFIVELLRAVPLPVSARIVRSFYDCTTPENLFLREAFLMVGAESFAAFVDSFERIYQWPAFFNAQMYGYAIILPLQTLPDSLYQDERLFGKCLVMAITTIKRVLRTVDTIELSTSFVFLLHVFGNVAQFLSLLPQFPSRCLRLCVKYLRHLMYIDVTLIEHYLKLVQPVGDPDVQRECGKLVAEMVREVCADPNLLSVVRGTFAVFRGFVRQYRGRKCTFRAVEHCLRLAAAVLASEEFAGELGSAVEFFELLATQVDWPSGAGDVWGRFIRAALRKEENFGRAEVEAFLQGMQRTAGSEQLFVLREIIVAAGTKFGTVAAENVEAIDDIAAQIDGPMMTEVEELFLVAAADGYSDAG
jgi:hypothetical protein